MAILSGLIITVFVLWSIHGLIEYLRDRRFNRATRHTNFENWRQVPPPNWASRRGTQDYW